MKKILITIVFIALCVVTFAQSGALPFLRLNTDARNAGMGNVSMGESTGMFIYTNPTSFLQDTTKMVYGSYSLCLLPKVVDKQVMFHSVSAGYKRGKYALLVGFRYLAGVEIPKVNELGISGKPIKPNDYSIDLTYTRHLGHNLSAYLTGSFIQSYIGVTSNTASASAGVYYRNSFSLSEKKIFYNVGIGIYDLGGTVKYDVVGYNQPTSTGLGGSFGLEMVKNHNLNLAWTTRYFILPTEASEITASLGLEYELYNMVGFRVGYHIEDGNNLATFGLGFKQDNFNLNVAYQMAEKNTLFLGCNVIF